MRGRSDVVLGVTLLFAAAFVVCAAVRRSAAVAVVVMLWPAYIAGVLLGLWGHGVGDNWQYGAVIGTAAAGAGAIAGTVAGRLVAASRSSAPQQRRRSGA